MTAYVIGFGALFIISGIGNGSVYKMIPVIVAAKSTQRPDMNSVEAAPMRAPDMVRDHGGV